MLRDERREMQLQLQDVTYRLGASESRVALLETAKPDDDKARRDATEHDKDEATEKDVTTAQRQDHPELIPLPNSEPAGKSFFGRLFG